MLLGGDGEGGGVTVLIWPHFEEFLTENGIFPLGQPSNTKVRPTTTKRLWASLIPFVSWGREKRMKREGPHLSGFGSNVIRRSFPIIVRNNYSWLQREVNQQTFLKGKYIPDGRLLFYLSQLSQSFFCAPLNWPTGTGKTSPAPISARSFEGELKELCGVMRYMGLLSEVSMFSFFIWPRFFLHITLLACQEHEA